MALDDRQIEHLARALDGSYRLVELANGDRMLVDAEGGWQPVAVLVPWDRYCRDGLPTARRAVEGSAPPRAEDVARVEGGGPPSPSPGLGATPTLTWSSIPEVQAERVDRPPPVPAAVAPVPADVPVAGRPSPLVTLAPLPSRAAPAPSPAPKPVPVESNGTNGHRNSSGRPPLDDLTVQRLHALWRGHPEQSSGWVAAEFERLYAREMHRNVALRYRPSDLPDVPHGRGRGHALSESDKAILVDLWESAPADVSTVEICRRFARRVGSRISEPTAVKYRPAPARPAGTSGGIQERAPPDRPVDPLRSVRLLTAEEEVELARRAHAGDRDARDRMIEANVRLVAKLADGYAKRNPGMDFDDLQAEGMLGLMRAVDKYDPDKGARFSTYAFYHIKQKIGRLIRGGESIVRYPDYLVEYVIKFKKTVSDATARGVGIPPDDEMARLMGIDPATLDHVKDALRAGVHASHPDGYEESSMEEYLADGRAPSVLDEVIRSLDVQDPSGLLGRLLDHLTERQRLVIQLRYGLGSSEPETSDKVGDRLGVTGSCVRQIEAKAMAILKREADRVARHEAMMGAEVEG